MRQEFGLPPDDPISAEEIELFWTLHGGIFYYGVRKVVYGLDLPIDKSTMIANAVDTFLLGASGVLKRAADAMPAKPRPRRTRRTKAVEA
jgi:hypothetical protein